MPKRFPEKVRLSAMEMYLKGDQPAKDIAAIISKTHKIDVTPSTIYSWARSLNWKNTRVEARTEAVVAVQEKESARFSRLQDEHLDTYERIRHQAEHELGNLNYTRAFDAAKAVDLGVQGERKVMEGLINLQFVQDILGVLIEEINDQEILKRVSLRMKGLMQSRAENG
jgi:transposase-like protein